MKEGKIAVTGGNIWYKILGEGSRTPLITLHGGPGFTSSGFEVFEAFEPERPVILYDQLGAGNSDRPDDLSLWQLDRFVEELGQIRASLGLDEVHILGHSWGTMLAAAYLLTKPSGVKSVIFSSPCLSAPLWAKDQAAYLKELPQDLQDVIARCEAEGKTDSEEYQHAMKVYYKRHLCRLDPWPPEMESGSKKANLKVYNTMWGPSEFCATGNLKEFDVTSRLHEIHIPTLFLCGRYDEATPQTTAHYQSLIPDAKLHIFEESAHKGYIEEPEEYLQVVRDFLKSV